MNSLPINIKSAFQDLSNSTFRGKLRLTGRYTNWLYYRTRRKLTGTTPNIFSQDWDNLIILDACREDLFEKSSGLQNSEVQISKESRITHTSNTVEFLRRNVAGKTLNDTVYVTANPQYRKFEDELNVEFHDVIDLWDYGWDEKIRTVLPEVTAEQAIDTDSTYPDKRLLIHFNQPHIPFIGESGRDILDFEEVANHPLPFWKQPMLTDNDIDDNAYWTAYLENLELTLPHVETLLSELQGKTVVTADHGNMVGDRGFPVPIKEYGHPGGIHYPELISVPWLEVDNGERKEILSEGPSDEKTNVSDQLESRLKDLGYV